MSNKNNNPEINNDKNNLPLPDNSNQDEDYADWYNKDDLEHPWIITRVKNSELNVT